MAEGVAQNITQSRRGTVRSEGTIDQTEALEKGKVSERVSRVDRFVYLGLIPGAFAAVLIAVVLSFYNIDVLAYGKKGYDTLLSLFHLPPSKPADTASDRLINEVQMSPQAPPPEGSQGTQAASDAEQMTADAARLKHLEDELVVLKEQIQALENDLQQRDDMLKKRQEALKTEARLLQAMSPSKAAAIVEQMGWYEAAELVGALNTESKAQILAKLAPEKAAGVMAVLREGLTDEQLAEGAQQDVLKRLTQSYDALYAQIKQSGGTPVQPALKDIMATSGNHAALSDPALTQIEFTASTLATMQPPKAAQVIQQLMERGKQNDALRLLSALDVATRGQILEALDPKLSAALISRWVTSP
ncbi:MAG: hypothetical protein IMX04_02380 [Candidatus Carbobacillus altaicus]|uniref:Magnesium transporter MgtE intracellular domain-containing protein n=1 Tax=Candidatus Carbonibacillus altaicus TaxID=2163959 RepID=A0A2R6Y4Y9_9BACL|nr:hypothetical protein [Candidatus Carbobacillus altaicus]PTQ57723.1 MAG: hypothetical protein BSOLF_0918 [Candidatus Carbobacillus altaicus]